MKATSAGPVFWRVVAGFLSLGVLQIRSEEVDLIRPIGKPDPFWLRENARQCRQFSSGRFRVCFLGDSLTAFWTAQGAGSWELDIKPFQPMNAGIAADRVENIHFRAQQRTFTTNSDPEVFVILAGTNNLGKDPPDDPESVASGVFALVRTLRMRWPQSRILILSILPSGTNPNSDLRKRILKTNQLLAQKTAPSGAAWLDVHDQFLDTAGNWREGLTIDGTHLTSRGYDVLASPVKEKLTEWLGE